MGKWKGDKHIYTILVFILSNCHIAEKTKMTRQYMEWVGKTKTDAK